MSQENYQLTKKEMLVFSILSSSQKSLIASDIVKMDNTLNINTVQVALRNLLRKKVIEIAEIVYSGTVLTRSYRPRVSLDDLVLKQFIGQLQHITTPNIVATLLKHEKNEEMIIEELEQLLKERKKLLINKEE